MAKFPYELAEFLPLRDPKVFEQVRRIKRADICRHPNKNFKIEIIEDQAAFGFAYVLDIVAGIRRSLEEGRRYVIILPAPNPQYAWVAEMINRLNISCKHVHTFNMDEYADQDGRTAPRDWKGGFQYWMWHDLFSRIDPKLRMPERQIHFPDTRNVNRYSEMIEDLGGADVCYGGIGWSGHIAFFEPHLGLPFVNDLEGYLEQGSRIVDLHPITVCQNSLFADAWCSGDLSACPPKAATIGPRDLKNSKLVSFWDGFTYGDVSWQKFISRLAAHGPVTPLVPASMLQILNSRLVLSGAIASDCVTESGERRTAIEFPKHPKWIR
jgi:glucosamine-6-phosphate deaminase